MSKQGLHRKFRNFASQFGGVKLPPRVLPGTIGIPVYRYLFNEFLDTIDSLQVPDGTVVMRKEGSYVQKNREWLANNFQGDWLFYADNDHIFPPETIIRLLSHNVPIVSGLYFKRGDNFDPQVWTWDHFDEVEKNNHYTPMIGAVGEYLKRHRDELTDGRIVKCLAQPELIECDAVGGGCLLVRREVFEKMDKPYFGNHVAEDLEFSRRVKEAGFKIYADLSVMVGHLYTIAVGYPHFLARNGYISVGG